MFPDDAGTCPWCGSRAIDVTCSGDKIRSFICTGAPCHDWQDGEGPDPEPEPEPAKESLLARVKKALF